MTTRTISGTYASGYTLSASYTGLSITTSGVVHGVTAAAYSGYSGGVGVLLSFAAPVTAFGVETGGAGGSGTKVSGHSEGGAGGAGGAGFDFAEGGSFHGEGTITGGAGGSGGESYAGGPGGAGGDAVDFSGQGGVNNYNALFGGNGGAGGPGTVGGAGGAGGAGIVLQTKNVVFNVSSVTAGAGGAGGYAPRRGGMGGDGGVGIELAGGGDLTNDGAIFGGAGGASGADDVVGSAASGGAAVSLGANGSVINGGVINGGQGGQARPNNNPSGGNGSPGGTGGVGVDLASGYIANSGTIVGGIGAMGAAGHFSMLYPVSGGHGGAGGDGAILRAGGSIANTGQILGGAGGAGGSGDVNGATGHFGDGVELLAGGNLTNGAGGVRGALIAGYYGIESFGGPATVTNYGTIRGWGVGIYLHDGGRIVNGIAPVPSALIEGPLKFGKTATVVNFGSLLGAVEFHEATDRLVAEAGSSGVYAFGHGGTLELAGGAETITNMGAVGTITGSLALHPETFGTYLIDLAASLVLSGNDTLRPGYDLIANGGIRLAASAVFTLQDGALATIQGAVSNEGAIQLQSTTKATELRIMPQGATLLSGGMITMSGPKCLIRGLSATTALTNFDTIVGTGYVGDNLLTLTNEAVIGASGGQMVVATKGEILTNTGLLNASGAGVLALIATTVANKGGAIEAYKTAVVDLEGDRIIGGTVGLAGAGLVAVNAAGGELDGHSAGSLTLAGLVEVLNGSNEILDGAIANTGQLDLFGGNKFADVIVGPQGATLSGKGQVNLSNSATNRIYGQAAADTLVNVDNRIGGAGQLGDGRLVLVNQAAGAIVGNSTVALTINTGSATIQNAGIIENAGKGGTVIASPLANTGTLFAVTAGTLTLAGAVSGAGTARIKGGTLYAKSSFSENVTFAGTTGILELAHSQTYTGKVTGLSKSGTSSLDLLDIAFTKSVTQASFSGTTASGTLTVTDGTHTAKIALLGDYIGSTFKVASDGHGGTTVVDPTAAAQRFSYTAAAALASTVAHHAALSAESWRPAPMLARPGAVLA